MTWVAVGLAGVGLVKGGMDAKAAKKKEQQNQRERQAITKYSPWTGMQDPGAQNFGTTDTMSGAIGGGLQGFSLGSSINGMGGGGNTKAATAAPAAVTPTPPGIQMSAMNYKL